MTTRIAATPANAASPRRKLGGRQRTSGDTRWLEWHGGEGGQWRVVVYVPKRLRKIIGKAALRRGLKTQDLRVAQSKRWPVVTEFKQLIAAADAKARGVSSDAVTAQALEWRQDIEDIRVLAEAPFDEADAEVLATTLGQMDEVLSSVAEQIESEHGALKAREFVSIASGRRTPLATYRDQWLKENHHKKRRTLGDYRRSVASLLAFAEKSGWPPTIETFSTRRAAGQYVSQSQRYPRRHAHDQQVHLRLEPILEMDGPQGTGEREPVA
jgi:hypothetical protein